MQAVLSSVMFLLIVYCKECAVKHKASPKLETYLKG